MKATLALLGGSQRPLQRVFDCTVRRTTEACPIFRDPVQLGGEEVPTLCTVSSSEQTPGTTEALQKLNQTRMWLIEVFQEFLKVPQTPLEHQM
jgi:hypothetical protein